MTLRIKLAVILFAASLTTPARPYSVLTHEEVVDMAWRDTIVPMLRARFPGITADDIRVAHAYAYGGSVIQDIGYYPFGSHYFSDLLHYVRPQDFVNALIHDSTTPDEYAFALGALAHYCGDAIGHPAVNIVTAQENPKLEQKYGRIVTYAEDPTAHIRTEFGFDVVEVSHGHYLQENYRDFIGFQVAKPLLERAFLETYGIPMNAVITHEDLAISTYRKSVSAIIPTMTKIAFATYKNDIQKAAPGIDKRRFIYRVNKTEYARSFGTEHIHLSFGAQVLAFFLKLMPKVGPFKALKPTIPNPTEQDIYLKSVNSTVDSFKHYLTQIQADPAPLPPVTAADAAETRIAAGKLQKAAEQASKDAGKAIDPTDKAQQQQTAQRAAQIAERMSADAQKEQSQATATAAGTPAAQEPGALPPNSPIAPPSTPPLTALDLDTGRPSTAGEYKLADETYAQLLAELIKLATKPGAPSQSVTSIEEGLQAPSSSLIDPTLAANIEQFFAHPVPRTGPAPSPHEAEKEAALAAQIKTNLATLKSLQTPSPVSTR